MFSWVESSRPFSDVERASSGIESAFGSRIVVSPTRHMFWNLMDYFWFEKIFQAFYFCFNFLNLPNLSIRIDDVGLPKDSEQIRFILSSRLVLYPVGAIDGRHEPNWFGRQIRARTQADGVRLTTFQDY